MQDQVDPAPKARFSKLAVVSVFILPVWILLFFLWFFLMARQFAVLTNPWEPVSWWVPAVTHFMFLFGFAAILGSIVMGHIAELRITKAGGLLRGKWLAKSAYIIGYAALLLIALCFFA